MYRYMVYIILPMTALANCNLEVTMSFLNRLDKDKNGSVERVESDDFFKKLDINGNKAITIEEVNQVVDRVAPDLKEDAVDLFNICDVNRDKVITPRDVDAIYRLIDLDKNNSSSTEEFEKFFQWYCWGDTVLER